jgi:hypothetical protein
MDLGLDTRVAGDDEGADEVLVVLHDAAVELEDGHLASWVRQNG